MKLLLHSQPHLGVEHICRSSWRVHVVHKARFPSTAKYIQFEMNKGRSHMPKSPLQQCHLKFLEVMNYEVYLQNCRQVVRAPLGLRTLMPPCLWVSNCSKVCFCVTLFSHVQPFMRSYRPECIYIVDVMFSSYCMVLMQLV